MFQEVKHRQTSDETQPVLLNLYSWTYSIMIHHHQPSFVQINRQVTLPKVNVLETLFLHDQELPQSFLNESRPSPVSSKPACEVSLHQWLRGSYPGTS